MHSSQYLHDVWPELAGASYLSLPCSRSGAAAGRGGERGAADHHACWTEDEVTDSMLLTGDDELLGGDEAALYAARLRAPHAPPAHAPHRVPTTPSDAAPLPHHALSGCAVLSRAAPPHTRVGC